MKNIFKTYFIVSLLLVTAVTCRKPYLPSAITAANRYLVVDGFINCNANGVTLFTLSRTRNLTDTITNIPELHASISIEERSGAVHDLADFANTGNYFSQPLSLDPSDEYRVKINTSDGNQFLSEYVPVKISAPIDSITWQQKADNNVTVYVNTHDPTKSTHYYKWDFVETWEHDSRIENYWGESNGLIFPLDATTQMHRCWTNASSANIITGTSVALSEDIISQQPITIIPQNDVRIKIRYSTLVRQIPITEDAFNYWSIIQKNSQQLGTLFDLQPSQLNGNIQSTTHPGEPVIGFITAATTAEQRLFIDHSQVINWDPTITGRECTEITIPTDPLNTLIYSYPDPEYAPYYFTGNSPTFLVLTRKECIDCREQGGVTTKPSFW